MVFFPVWIPYGIITLPFQLIFGSPQALPGVFHWLSIFSFALTGFLTFLIAKKISNRFYPSILAGILFSFLPFHYWHLPRCHSSCLELILLPIYFYLRLLEDKSKKAGILFGLSLTPLTYQSPNYLLYLAIFLALHWAYLFFTNRALFNKNWLQAISIALLVNILLSSPFLFFLAKELITKTTPASSILGEQNRYSANLLGLVLPGPNQKIYQAVGNFSENIIAQNGSSGKEIFPGYILLLSGILGIFFSRKTIKNYGFWVLSFLVFFILSLGPFLKFGKYTLFHPELPYFFLSKIFPFMEMDRSPVRMIIFVHFSLAMLSLGFFSQLEPKIAQKKKKFLLGLISALALIELNQAPIYLTKIPLPEIYQNIAQEKDKFTVLELPLLPETYRYAGIFQTYHRKYLAIDLTARKVGAGFYDRPMFFYLDEPLRFLLLTPEEQDQAKKEIETELGHRKIKYIILYLKFMDEEKIADLDRLLKILKPTKIFYSEPALKVYQFELKEN